MSLGCRSRCQGLGSRDLGFDHGRFEYQGVSRLQGLLQGLILLGVSRIMVGLNFFGMLGLGFRVQGFRV